MTGGGEKCPLFLQSFYFASQQLLLLTIHRGYEALQQIADLNGAYPCGGASEDEVTLQQLEILGNVGDDVSEGKKHVTGVAVLHHLAVFLELKLDVAAAADPVQRHELAQYRRVVEALGDFPGMAFFLEFLLYVTGGKVNAERHFLVVAVGKLRLYGLAVFADFQHHLALIVQVFSEVRVVERLLVDQQGRWRLHEHNGLSHRHWVVEFLGVVGVVAAYADDFHVKIVGDES